MSLSVHFLPFVRSWPSLSLTSLPWIWLNAASVPKCPWCTPSSRWCHTLLKKTMLLIHSLRFLIWSVRPRINMFWLEQFPDTSPPCWASSTVDRVSAVYLDPVSTTYYGSNSISSGSSPWSDKAAFNRRTNSAFSPQVANLKAPQVEIRNHHFVLMKIPLLTHQWNQLFSVNCSAVWTELPLFMNCVWQVASE